MTKTYILFPKILHGFECEIWANNRRQVIKDVFKGWKIDGIKGNIGVRWFWFWTATTKY
jgi:hypothetical protein